MRFWLGIASALLVMGCAAPPAGDATIQTPVSSTPSLTGTKRIVRDGKALYCRTELGSPQTRGAASGCRTANTWLPWRTVSCFRTVRNVRRTTQGDMSAPDDAQMI